MFDLEKIEEAIFRLPKKEHMHVPGLIVATDKLMEELQLGRSLEQVENVAQLKGIIGYSIAMPDIHWGYGFPIGGVAAMDVDSGVISPGGVGYDINCGVRLALIDIPFSDISSEKQEKLLNMIFEKIPSGVGRGRRNVRGLSERDYKEIAEKGSRWSVEKGYGFQEDIDHTESYGVLQGADISVVSDEAKERGKNQLGTIGSGNHFVEVGEVAENFLPEVAKAWNVKKGMTYCLIHTGSRGFGHQICQDTLNIFMKKGYAEGLPDKQLVCAPIQSEDGKRYFQAMATAANFAFNNRQQILHFVREAFYETLGVNKEEIKLLYDVCHNIAKFETYKIDGKEKKVCVHRKGATRAFGPSNEELPSIYKNTGQPVLVPGDMGRASYILVGEGNQMTWSSCCHGAGRAKSRAQTKKGWQGKNLVEHMEKQGIHVKASSYRTIAEEMPDAYKNVEDVVEAVELAHLAKIVARLKPHLVVKG